MANTEVLTIQQQRNGHAWFSIRDHADGKCLPGAIRVGSRWQPIVGTARCVRGYLRTIEPVMILSDKKYHTMRQAVQAARAQLESEAE